jgi:Protein of unknown function (DUF2934)
MSKSDSDRERRAAAVRVRAYLLWEEAGRPHGRDLELWLQAEQEVVHLADPADAFAGGSGVEVENKPFPRAAAKRASPAAASAAKPKLRSVKPPARAKKVKAAAGKTAAATTKRKTRATPALPVVDGATS